MSIRQRPNRRPTRSDRDVNWTGSWDGFLAGTSAKHHAEHDKWRGQQQNCSRDRAGARWKRAPPGRSTQAMLIATAPTTLRAGAIIAPAFTYSSVASILRWLRFRPGIREILRQALFLLKPRRGSRPVEAGQSPRSRSFGQSPLSPGQRRDAV